MDTTIPEGQMCEVCNQVSAEVLVDLNTDEESGPVFWYACTTCGKAYWDAKPVHFEAN